MKKMFVATLMILALIGFASVAVADDTTAPAPSGAALTTPSVTAIGAGMPINLSGDTVFLVKNQNFGVGLGADLATAFDGILTVRAEAVAIVDKSSGQSSEFIGIGPMVNIPKLITKAGGTWSLPVINPSLGVMPFYSLAGNSSGTGSKFDAGIVLSIIQVKF